ncbi:(d)CMP kinase [Chrysiogenes arsenatis]|uniref:(d)CMP kinase n=1 Tax=Chrysiogenes arsenatis TaxID=309797 RepID=UPI0003F5E4BA|nr:(d)CMP kinase [Chrysiogenes arsenatis]
MQEKPVRIALDGPGGSGKSTVGKRIAKQYGFTYIDTGAMYRCVALRVRQMGIEMQTIEYTAAMENLSIEFRWEENQQRVLLNGVDVTQEIRMPDNARVTSLVAQVPEIRSALVEMQRQLAQAKSVVMDGRDIGSVVIPDAELKFFMDASPETRAQRRFEELQQQGVSVTFDDVLRDIQQRDYDDCHREFSPLIQVADAIVIDTTNYDIDGVTKLIAEHIDSILCRQEH